MNATAVARPTSRTWIIFILGGFALLAAWFVSTRATFVTFRIGIDALTSNGVAPGDAQASMAWACWAIPLMLLEPVLQLRRAR